MRRPVYALMPMNGTRLTASLWAVGKLVAGGTFEVVTAPMTRGEADARMGVLRTQAHASKAVR